MRLNRSIAVVFALLLAAAASGCSAPTVAMEPAEAANDPACAEVMVRLPSTIGEHPRRWTDAQATAAWGDPQTVVLLTCGVPPPGPSELPCRSANGVDWLIDESEADRYRVTSFGRVPAVELYLDRTTMDPAQALEALSRVVGVLPADGSVCLDGSDLE